MPSPENQPPYGVARINATTLARVATAPTTWAEILAFHRELATDDYVRYVDNHYRDNLRRYGEHWHYLDIVNVLYAASKALQPRSYLEIGVRRGRSVCTVARGCPTVDVVACDMWQANYAGMENPGPDLVKSELAKNGHRGTVVFANGDSHVLLPKIFADHPQLQFDMITVDGDHSAEGAYRDLCDVAPHLTPGGVLVFDDISHPAHTYLLGVWRKFVAEHSYLSSYEYVEQGYGVAFAIRTT
jgi:predicted O-methyltransferase YrrM